jgi:2-amino-4-hydroxy-6-hydroxymethyldihydropteridine diphosphokinase
MGERAENCRRAIAGLAACEGCLMDGQSPLYETEPVMLEDQSWFVNCVAKIRTRLFPEALRTELEAIERAMGRVRGGPRFGPRVLDLDILFYDDLILRATQLEIPHPRLHERRFVLEPLCDLSPELVHPVLGETIRSLLYSLRDGRKKVTQLL